MDKIRKSEEAWRSELTEDEFRVTRQQGTEPAFSGRYWRTTGEQGDYLCRCCGLPLFESNGKFDSGSGWPSFTAPVDREHVRETADTTLGMRRTEVLCARCDAHLGHVFPDGPKPTGLRYCINSASLDFKPEEGESEESA